MKIKRSKLSKGINYTKQIIDIWADSYVIDPLGECLFACSVTENYTTIFSNSPQKFVIVVLDVGIFRITVLK